MKRSVSVIAVFLLSLGLAFGQDEKPMFEIHGAMISNFLKYVQWPNEAEGGEFVFGVLGDDELFNLMKTRYDGKPKGAKKFVIKKLASGAEAATCNAIYLGKSKNKEFESIKTSIAGKHVLTITDSNNLGQKGSCINFKVQDGKLKFELNSAALTGSSLKVASQLASIAINI